MAWVYLRVSTDRQDTEMQRLQVIKFAESHGFTVPESRWYVEEATHGTVPAIERPYFLELHDELLKQSKGQLPRNVLMYEVSRIGRTFWETLEAIKFLEDLSPILSTSPKESFLQVDDKSMRHLFLGILAWAAEREREVLVQRTRDGVARAKDEGRHSGNIPLGYSIHDCEEMGHPQQGCEKRGKLYMNDLGKKARALMVITPNIRAVQLQRELGLDYKQAWNLLQSVKKFGN